MQPVQAQEVVTSSSWCVPSLQLSPYLLWCELWDDAAFLGFPFCWYLLGSLGNVPTMLFKKVECFLQSSPVYTNFQEKESTFFFSLETHKIPPGGLNTNILCHAFDWLVLLLFTTYTPSLCSPAELHSVPSAFHYPGSGSKEKSLPLKTRFWMSTSAILAVKFVVFCVAQWWFF